MIIPGIKLSNDAKVNKSIIELSLSPEIPRRGDTVIVLVECSPHILESTSFLQANPLIFKIGEDAMIKGLEIGILSMRKGEVSLIEMTWDYMGGIEDIVVPAIHLPFMFQIRLLDILRPGAVDVRAEREKGKSKNVKEEKKANVTMEKALKAKEEGNNLYKEKAYSKAGKKYEEALSLLESCTNDPKYKEVKLALLLNISAVCIQSNDNSKAVDHCSHVLLIDPSNIKALYRRGTAYINLGYIDKAIFDFERGAKLAPENQEIRSELQRLKPVEETPKVIYKGRPATNFSDQDNPIALLEISIGGQTKQTLEFELFKNIVPRTVENFMQICLAEHSEKIKGKRKGIRKVFHYKGSVFHCLKRGVLIKGGDFEKGNGTGGKSIYGKTFSDENFEVSHSCRGVLSMANQEKPDSNGSQFFITFKENRAFDGKNVAFGLLKKGMDFLDRLENVSCDGEKPINLIQISECFAAEGIFQLRGEKEILIVQRFLQRKFEVKADNHGVQIMFDYLNQRVLISRRGDLFTSFKEEFGTYTSETLELTFEVFDFAKGENLKLLRENYQKIQNWLLDVLGSNFKIGAVLSSEFEALNKEQNDFFIKPNFNCCIVQIIEGIVFKIEVVFQNRARSGLISKIQSIIQKFGVYPLIFSSQRPSSFNKCFSIDFPELPMVTFLVGERKDINEIRNQYERKTMRVQLESDQLKFLSDKLNGKIFKEFTIQFMARIGLPSDSDLSIEGNDLKIVTSDAREIKSKVLEFTPRFISLYKLNWPLASNEIDFCRSNPNILKCMEKTLQVEFLIPQAGKENCLLEIGKNGKRLFVFNSSFPDFSDTAYVEIDSLSKFGQFSRNFSCWRTISMSNSETEVKFSRNARTGASVLNVCWPQKDCISSKNLYCNMIEDALRKIIREGEAQQLKVLAIPFFGFDIFQAKLEEIFLLFIKVLQEEFFQKNAQSLKDIYILEAEEKMALNLKNLMRDFVSGASICKKKQRLIWKWLNDKKNFEAYDADLNEKINEAFEKDPNQKIELVLDPLKTPGTHQFNLQSEIVTDLTRQVQESLSSRFGLWFHNNIPYSKEISRIIQKKSDEDEDVFELFLKSYYMDFQNMVQINQSTSFQRSLKIEFSDDFDDDDDDNAFNLCQDIKALKYDKINIFDEPTDIGPEGSLVIVAKSEIPNVLEAQIQLKKVIDIHFDTVKIKMPYFLSLSKIQIIKSFCKKERIQVNAREIKSNEYVNFICPKAKILSLEQKIKDLEYDYPWDNCNKDFQIVCLSSSGSGDESKDYEFVLKAFRNSIPMNKVLSIKRIQNNDLYTNFMNSVTLCLKFKEKNGIFFGKEEGFQYLWHGTRTSDPFQLIDRKTSALSTQYASDNGMWGRGIYFAKNASYSDNFSFQREKGVELVKYLLFCKVFTGKSKKMQPNQSIREPPYIDENKKVLFDSIEGETGNSVVFILYENDRCYPHYLIEYI